MTLQIKKSGREATPNFIFHCKWLLRNLQMMALGFFLSMPVISMQAQIVPPPTTYFDLTSDELTNSNGILGFRSTISSSRFAQLLTSAKYLRGTPYNSTSVRYNVSSTDCLKLTDQVPEYQFGTYSTSYFYGMSVSKPEDLPNSYTMAGWFYFDFNLNGNNDLANICGLLDMGPIVELDGRTSNLSTAWVRTVDQNFALDTNRFVAFNPFGGIEVQNRKWHFIAVTQSKYITRMYVGNKDLNTFNCTSMPLGWQNPVGQWKIGNPLNKGLTAADDIMLWDYALSSDQIKALYECSKDKNPMSGNCWQSANANTSTARSAAPVAAKLQVSQSDPEPTAEPEKIDVYPNPTQGPLQVDVNLREPSLIEINVHDLKGILIYSTTATLAVGKTHLQVNLQNETRCNCPGLSTQMVIVTIRTSKLLTAQKVIIQP